MSASMRGLTRAATLAIVLAAAAGCGTSTSPTPTTELKTPEIPPVRKEDGRNPLPPSPPRK